MSEVDLAIKKVGLAKNIKAHLIPEKPSMDIELKIIRLLLTPEIIPILEERIAAG